MDQIRELVGIATGGISHLVAIFSGPAGGWVGLWFFVGLTAFVLLGKLPSWVTWPVLGVAVFALDQLLDPDDTTVVAGVIMLTGAVWFFVLRILRGLIEVYQRTRWTTISKGLCLIGTCLWAVAFVVQVFPVNTPASVGWVLDLLGAGCFAGAELIYRRYLRLNNDIADAVCKISKGE